MPDLTPAELERLRVIVAKVEDVEGTRKAILAAMRPHHGILSAEETARAIRDYLMGRDE